MSKLNHLKKIGGNVLRSRRQPPEIWNFPLMTGNQGEKGTAGTNNRKRSCETHRRITGQEQKNQTKNKKKNLLTIKHKKGETSRWCVEKTRCFKKLEVVVCEGR